MCSCVPAIPSLGKSLTGLPFFLKKNNNNECTRSSGVIFTITSVRQLTSQNQISMHLFLQLHDNAQRTRSQPSARALEQSPKRESDLDHISPNPSTRRCPRPGFEPPTCVAFSSRRALSHTSIVGRRPFSSSRVAPPLYVTRHSHSAPC